MPKILPGHCTDVLTKTPGFVHGQQLQLPVIEERPATAIFDWKLYIFVGPIPAFHVDRSFILWRVPAPSRFTAVSMPWFESSCSEGEE